MSATAMKTALTGETPSSPISTISKMGPHKKNPPAKLGAKFPSGGLSPTTGAGLFKKAGPLKKGVPVSGLATSPAAKAFAKSPGGGPLTPKSASPKGPPLVKRPAWPPSTTAATPTSSTTPTEDQFKQQESSAGASSSSNIGSPVTPSTIVSGQIKWPPRTKGGDAQSTEDSLSLLKQQSRDRKSPSLASLTKSTTSSTTPSLQRGTSSSLQRGASESASEKAGTGVHEKWGRNFSSFAKKAERQSSGLSTQRTQPNPADSPRPYLQDIRSRSFSKGSPRQNTSTTAKSTSSDSPSSLFRKINSSAGNNNNTKKTPTTTTTTTAQEATTPLGTSSSELLPKGQETAPKLRTFERETAAPSSSLSPSSSGEKDNVLATVKPGLVALASSKFSGVPLTRTQSDKTGTGLNRPLASMASQESALGKSGNIVGSVKATPKTKQPPVSPSSSPKAPAAALKAVASWKASSSGPIATKPAAVIPDEHSSELNATIKPAPLTLSVPKSPSAVQLTTPSRVLTSSKTTADLVEPPALVTPQNLSPPQRQEGEEEEGVASYNDDGLQKLTSPSAIPPAILSQHPHPTTDTPTDGEVTEDNDDLETNGICDEDESDGAVFDKRTYGDTVVNAGEVALVSGEVDSEASHHGDAGRDLQDGRDGISSTLTVDGVSGQPLAALHRHLAAASPAASSPRDKATYHSSTSLKASSSSNTASSTSGLRDSQQRRDPDMIEKMAVVSSKDEQIVILEERQSRLVESSSQSEWLHQQGDFNRDKQDPNIEEESAIYNSWNQHQAMQGAVFMTSREVDEDPETDSSRDASGGLALRYEGSDQYANRNALNNNSGNNITRFININSSNSSHGVGSHRLRHLQSAEHLLLKDPYEHGSGLLVINEETTSRSDGESDQGGPFDKNNNTNNNEGVDTNYETDNSAPGIKAGRSNSAHSRRELSNSDSNAMPMISTAPRGYAQSSSPTFSAAQPTTMAAEFSGPSVKTLLSSVEAQMNNSNNSHHEWQQRGSESRSNSSNSSRHGTVSRSSASIHRRGVRSASTFEARLAVTDSKTRAALRPTGYHDREDDGCVSSTLSSTDTVRLQLTDPIQSDRSAVVLPYRSPRDQQQNEDTTVTTTTPIAGSKSGRQRESRMQQHGAVDPHSPSRRKNDGLKVRSTATTTTTSLSSSVQGSAPEDDALGSTWTEILASKGLVVSQMNPPSQGLILNTTATTTTNTLDSIHSNLSQSTTEATDQRQYQQVVRDTARRTKAHRALIQESTPEDLIALAWQQIGVVSRGPNATAAVISTPNSVETSPSSKRRSRQQGSSRATKMEPSAAKGAKMSTPVSHHYHDQPKEARTTELTSTAAQPADRAAIATFSTDAWDRAKGVKKNDTDSSAYGGKSGSSSFDSTVQPRSPNSSPHTTVETDHPHINLNSSSPLTSTHKEDEDGFTSASSATVIYYVPPPFPSAPQLSLISSSATAAGTATTAAVQSPNTIGVLTSPTHFSSVEGVIAFERLAGMAAPPSWSTTAQRAAYHGVSKQSAINDSLTQTSSRAFNQASAILTPAASTSRWPLSSLLSGHSIAIDARSVISSSLMPSSPNPQLQYRPLLSMSHAFPAQKNKTGSSTASTAAVDKELLPHQYDVPLTLTANGLASSSFSIADAKAPMTLSRGSSASVQPSAISQAPQQQLVLTTTNTNTWQTSAVPQQSTAAAQSLASDHQRRISAEVSLQMKDETRPAPAVLSVSEQTTAVKSSPLPSEQQVTQMTISVPALSNHGSVYAAGSKGLDVGRQSEQIADAATALIRIATPNAAIPQQSSGTRSISSLGTSHQQLLPSWVTAGSVSPLIASQSRTLESYGASFNRAPPSLQTAVPTSATASQSSDDETPTHGARAVDEEVSSLWQGSLKVERPTPAVTVATPDPIEEIKSQTNSQGHDGTGPATKAKRKQETRSNSVAVEGSQSEVRTTPPIVTSLRPVCTTVKSRGLDSNVASSQLTSSSSVGSIKSSSASLSVLDSPTSFSPHASHIVHRSYQTEQQATQSFQSSRDAPLLTQTQGVSATNTYTVGGTALAPTPHMLTPHGSGSVSGGAAVVSVKASPIADLGRSPFQYVAGSFVYTQGSLRTSATTSTSSSTGERTAILGGTFSSSKGDSDLTASQSSVDGTLSVPPRHSKQPLQPPQPFHETDIVKAAQYATRLGAPLKAGPVEGDGSVDDVIHFQHSFGAELNQPCHVQNSAAAIPTNTNLNTTGDSKQPLAAAGMVVRARGRQSPASSSSSSSSGTSYSTSSSATSRLTSRRSSSISSTETSKLSLQEYSPPPFVVHCASSTMRLSFSDTPGRAPYSRTTDSKSSTDSADIANAAALDDELVSGVDVRVEEKPEVSTERIEEKEETFLLSAAAPPLQPNRVPSASHDILEVQEIQVSSREAPLITDGDEDESNHPNDGVVPSGLNGGKDSEAFDPTREPVLDVQSKVALLSRPLGSAVLGEYRTPLRSSAESDLRAALEKAEIQQSLMNAADSWTLQSRTINIKTLDAPTLEAARAASKQQEPKLVSTSVVRRSVVSSEPVLLNGAPPAMAHSLSRGMSAMTPTARQLSGGGMSALYTTAGPALGLPRQESLLLVENNMRVDSAATTAATANGMLYSSGMPSQVNKVPGQSRVLSAALAEASMHGAASAVVPSRSNGAQEGQLQAGYHGDASESKLLDASQGGLKNEAVAANGLSDDTDDTHENKGAVEMKGDDEVKVQLRSAPSLDSTVVESCSNSSCSELHGSGAVVLRKEGASCECLKEDLASSPTDTSKRSPDNKSSRKSRRKSSKFIADTEKAAHRTSSTAVERKQSAMRKEKDLDRLERRSRAAVSIKSHKHHPHRKELPPAHRHKRGASSPQDLNDGSHSARSYTSDARHVGRRHTHITNDDHFYGRGGRHREDSVSTSADYYRASKVSPKLLMKGFKPASPERSSAVCPLFC